MTNQKTKNMGPKIICNVSLANGLDKQVIYCSQLYETFFSVSTTLNLVKDKEGKERLASMDLFLLNYKGPFNLGILPAETANSFEYEDGNMLIVLHLQANNGMYGIASEKAVNIPCNNLLVGDLKSLLTTRMLHPIHDNVNDMGMLLQRGIFDSEFFVRDGVDIAPKKNELDAEIKEETTMDLSKRISITTTGRCETTLSKFV